MLTGYTAALGEGHDVVDTQLATARGEPPPEEWSPEFNLGLAGRIPQGYVPDAEVRKLLK